MTARLWDVTSVMSLLASVNPTGKRYVLEWKHWLQNGRWVRRCPIVVTSHERHGFSNNSTVCSTDCSVNYRENQSTLLGTTGDRWIPLTKGQEWGTVSMSWRDHEKTYTHLLIIIIHHLSSIHPSIHHPSIPPHPSPHSSSSSSSPPPPPPHHIIIIIILLLLIIIIIIIILIIRQYLL